MLAEVPTFSQQIAPDLLELWLAAYLSLLELLTHEAFSLARWHALSSEVINRRYKNTPMAKRVCLCVVW